MLEPVHKKICRTTRSGCGLTNVMITRPSLPFSGISFSRNGVRMQNRVQNIARGFSFSLHRWSGGGARPRRATVTNERIREADTRARS